MTLGPRAKLVLLMSLFLVPIVASLVAYRYVQPTRTTNYGELVAQTPLGAQTFQALDGAPFELASLAGRWVIVVSDSGRCPPPCLEKLRTVRQVRLALGRNASRVARVFVVDDLARPSPALLAEIEGTIVALTPPGLQVPPGAANDRAHIYLADPRGQVMMRWPAQPEGKRMLRDLERLLKASQIG